MKNEGSVMHVQFYVYILKCGFKSPSRSVFFVVEFLSVLYALPEIFAVRGVKSRGGM